MGFLYDNLTTVITVKEAFSEQLCDSIVHAKSEHNLQFGTVGGDVGERVESEQRTSRICFLHKIYDSPAYHCLNSIISKVNAEAYDFDLNEIETSQFTEYCETYKGHYNFHRDSHQLGDSIRKLSIVVQLSNPSDYEGGVFEFKNDVELPEHWNKKGTAIVFPSEMGHRVTPVTKGKRYSLVTWVLGPPFR